jgi:hypothetical protein
MVNLQLILDPKLVMFHRYVRLPEGIPFKKSPILPVHRPARRGH